jgi:membrane associated rhomboid family serine protease/Zn-finger nucleic acid-binding protein
VNKYFAFFCENFRTETHRIYAVNFQAGELNLVVISAIISAMKCPFCSNRLQAVKFKSDVVDICPSCRGIWFDSGEFVAFVNELAKSEEITPETPPLFKPRPVQPAGKTEEQSRICPRCKKKMRKFNYAYDSNVFLDKCPNCGGIWTDGGEVRQIARYLKHNPQTVAFGESLIKTNQTLEDLGELAETIKTPGFWCLPKIIIPISDDTPRQRTPLITISLMALCVFAFFAQIIFVMDLEGFYESSGFVAGRFLHLSLITSMFLHGSIFHLIGNMLFLWIFGDNVEDRFSHLGYLGFYFSCGLAASILHTLFNLGSSTPAIGASGAISGVMGAYCIFSPMARIKSFFAYRTLYLPASLYLGFWFLFQLMFGLLYHSVGLSNIAWFAHIGGFGFGAIVAYLKKKGTLAGK